MYYAYCFVQECDGYHCFSLMLSERQVQCHDLVLNLPGAEHHLCNQWLSGITLWTQLQLKISIFLWAFPILEWFYFFKDFLEVSGFLWLSVTFSQAFRSDCNEISVGFFTSFDSADSSCSIFNTYKSRIFLSANSRPGMVTHSLSCCSNVLR